MSDAPAIRSDFRLEDHLFPDGAWLVKEAPRPFVDVPRISDKPRSPLLERVKLKLPQLPWHLYPQPEPVSVLELACWLSDQPKVYAVWMIDTADLSREQRQLLRYYYATVVEYKLHGFLYQVFNEDLGLSPDA